MFDSGLGGMSIVMAIRDELPDAEIVYFADSGRAPYGRRPLQVVRSFSEEITIRLLEQGARDDRGRLQRGLGGGACTTCAPFTLASLSWAWNPP